MSGVDHGLRPDGREAQRLAPRSPPAPGWPVLALALAMALALAATPALASDFRGISSGLLTFTLAVPLAAASLLAFGVLALSGAYRSRRVALWHTALACVPPLLAAAATLADSRSVGDVGFRLLVNGLMLLLAQLPLLAHALRGRS